MTLKRRAPMLNNGEKTISPCLVSCFHNAFTYAWPPQSHDHTMASVTAAAAGRGATVMERSKLPLFSLEPRMQECEQASETPH